MRIARAHLQSVSPYSQGKHYELPKLDRELHKDYEERTWRERLHYDTSNEVYIPPMALKNSLSEAAKFLALQIPGKGKSTYTKHFESGVLVTEPLKLYINKDDVQGQWLFVPSDGVRGSGKRVNKCFPVIAEWSGEAIYYILDDIITKDVFEKVLDTAGKFIGIGVFRPKNNGFFGRYTSTSVTFTAA